MKTEPLQVTVNMILKKDNLQMVYESNIHAQGSMASWQGLAAIDYYGACFYQKCHTLCTDTVSYKAWRDHWVETNNCSPVPLIQSWMEAVGNGKGRYYKYPVMLSEEIAADDVPAKEVYCVILSEQEPQWEYLCDVHPDSTFGGMSLIDGFRCWDVRLYFSTEDYKLTAALILAGKSNNRANVLLILKDSQIQPAVTVADLDIVEGPLAEERAIETEEEG